MPGFDIILLGWCANVRKKWEQPKDQSSVPRLNHG